MNCSAPLYGLEDVYPYCEGLHLKQDGTTTLSTVAVVRTEWT